MYDLGRGHEAPLAPCPVPAASPTWRDACIPMVAEVTELTEKVDNALQVTEDVYLARIYTAALELYRVPTVSAAVERKLSIIRDTYTALYDEAHASRSEVLEIIILLMIAVEIVLAVVR